MAADPVKTRFAPSPTGFLHQGNTRTVLFSALAARRDGGVFVLSIEDADPDRSREEFVHKAFAVHAAACGADRRGRRSRDGAHTLLGAAGRLRLEACLG